MRRTTSARAATLLPIMKNVPFAPYWSRVSSSSLVYGPGPSSKVRAMQAWAQDPEGAGAAGAGVAIGLGCGLGRAGMVAICRAWVVCNAARILVKGREIVIVPYDDGTSAAWLKGQASALSLAIMKLVSASSVTISPRSTAGCWRSAIVAATERCAASMTVRRYAVLPPTRSRRVIAAPVCLLNVQNRVKLAG